MSQLSLPVYAFRTAAEKLVEITMGKTYYIASRLKRGCVHILKLHAGVTIKLESLGSYTITTN